MNEMPPLTEAVSKEAAVNAAGTILVVGGVILLTYLGVKAIVTGKNPLQKTL